MKFAALRGKPDAMIDAACIRLATIDDLHMQFDIVIIIQTCTVQSQCASNSAAIYMMILEICTGMYFMKTGILTVK